MAKPRALNAQSVRIGDSVELYPEVWYEVTDREVASGGPITLHLVAGPLLRLNPWAKVRVVRGPKPLTA